MTNTRLKLAIVWYWERASEILPNWRDGYRAAFEVIAKEHEVHWFLDKTLPGEGFDYIHVWDDSNSPALRLVRPLAPKVGLSLTTDPSNFENLRLADVVFAESEPVYEAVRRQGLRCIRAFGTDTNFFAPDKAIVKDIPYFYPATFSPWKRQEDIAHLGDKLYLVGTVQPDGTNQFDACVKAGCHVEEGYFPAEKIRDYYHRAQKVIIPAVHGSERTLLEAYSMNIPVVILHPETNKRLASYETEYQQHSEFPCTRDFVLGNYSHEIMARDILRGIL